MHIMNLKIEDEAPAPRTFSAACKALAVTVAFPFAAVALPTWAYVLFL